MMMMIYIKQDIGIIVRVFTNVPGNPGSISGRVTPKTQKMVLDTSLLNTQHYEVRIKGKVEQSRKRSKALPYTFVLLLSKREPSGSPSTKVANFTFTYIYIYIYIYVCVCVCACVNISSTQFKYILSIYSYLTIAIYLSIYQCLNLYHTLYSSIVYILLSFHMYNLYFVLFYPSIDHQLKVYIYIYIYIIYIQFIYVLTVSYLCVRLSVWIVPIWTNSSVYFFLHESERGLKFVFEKIFFLFLFFFQVQNEIAAYDFLSSGACILFDSLLIIYLLHWDEQTNTYFTLRISNWWVRRQNEMQGRKSTGKMRSLRIPDYAQ